MSEIPNKKSKVKGGVATASVIVAALNETLWHACRNGNRMQAQAAIAAGADVNYSHEGTNCLFVAAMKGYNEIVVFFVESWC
jgi:hypothetical protein